MGMQYEDQMSKARVCRGCDSSFKYLPSLEGYSIRVNRETCYLCKECVVNMYLDLSSRSLEDLCNAVEAVDDDPNSG